MYQHNMQPRQPRTCHDQYLSEYSLKEASSWNHTAPQKSQTFQCPTAHPWISSSRLSLATTQNWVEWKRNGEVGLIYSVFSDTRDLYACFSKITLISPSQLRQNCIQHLQDSIPNSWKYNLQGQVFFTTLEPPDSDVSSLALEQSLLRRRHFLMNCKNLSF